MLPNFLVVGAEKAGTTTLAALLGQHPDIFMSDPKEPMFFSHHNWDKGLSWYESLFDSADGYTAVGEASPGYTWAPMDTKPPKRINECLGDIKYIYILRHPIERMISQYRHAIFWRWIPDKTSFGEALEKVQAIVNCSRYYYQIEQYLPYTLKNKWHIILLPKLSDFVLDRHRAPRIRGEEPKMVPILGSINPDFNVEDEFSDDRASFY